MIAIALVAVRAEGGDTPTPSGKAFTGNAGFKDEIRPLLAKYCISCHGPTKPKGDLNLAAYADGDSILKAPKVWELVADYVESGEMPPKEKDKSRPSQSESEKIVAWVTGRLSQLDCTKSSPGRVTLRRLNRVEYNNTVKDLVNVDLRLADDFPSDDVGYGFDNIGDVLTMPPILMEKYLAAADKIAEQAIVTDEPSRGPIVAFPPIQGRKTGANVQPYDATGINLYTNGQIAVTFKAPKDGEYVFRVKAFGQQAGKEPVKMGLLHAGKPLKAFNVKAVEGAALPFEFKLKLKAGESEFAVAFLNDFFDETVKDPKRRDRNLVIEGIEVQGPPDTEIRNLPQSHRSIFITRKAEWTTSEYRRAILENLAYRAYRRTPLPDEVERLAKLAEMVEKDGGRFEEGIQIALKAILVSPYFLFKVEYERKPRSGQDDLAFAISDFELATRLSYFLWSSMPDRELLDLAKSKKLQDESVLTEQVQRMLKSRKSSQFVENFAGQWLQLRNLRNVQPDKKQFPEFDDSLRSAMQKEAELYFATILKEDRSVLEFLDSDWTVVNARLARFYGVPFTRNGGTAINEQYRKVTLTDGRRGGVLTMASVLTVTSNPTRTSPVKRGKWVLEQLLGTPPPPPPPDIPELDDAKGALTGTLRQKMEQHRVNPSCAVCHSKLDPLGFSLENFNAIGAWRDKEGESPIDASGILPSGQKFSGPKELRAILLTKKADFVHCLAEKMMTYAVGRGLEYKDKCAVDQVTAALEKNEYKFSVLVTEIVRSDPFRKRNAKGRD